MRRGAIWAGAAFAGAAVWPALTANAAPPPAGFTISPAYQYVTVGAAEQTEYDLRITNHTAYSQNFRLDPVDFGSLNEQGGVAFLGAPATELEHKYGLASWMTLESNTVFVPTGQSTSVVVHISNRPSLAPGGHYGALLATAVTDTGQIGVGGHVGVKQVLASLVLATKEGGAQRIIGLKGQTSNGSFWRLPTTVEDRFENAGNVHVIPRGVVRVVDPWGKTVKRGALNESSGAILPESIRRYKTPLMDVARGLLPGRYQLVTEYRDETTDAVKTYKTGFFYVGSVLTWVVMLSGLAIGYLLVYFAWRWRRFWWRPRKGRRKS